MREIKFRAWIDNERYIYSCDYKSLSTFFSVCFSEMRSCDTILEQFTGLRDKNGREIYEGDIINAIISEFRIETMGEVIYSEYYSAFVNKNHAGETLLLKLDDFEIIGNIHENQELLK